MTTRFIPFEDAYYFHLELTMLCNLNCSYCFLKYKRYGKPCVFPYNDIDKLCCIFKKLHKRIYLYLSGGEPTIYKNIETICKEILKKCDNVHIVLTTNGIKTIVCNSIDPNRFSFLLTYHRFAQISKFVKSVKYYSSKGFTVIVKFIYQLNNAVVSAIEHLPNVSIAFKDDFFDPRNHFQKVYAFNNDEAVGFMSFKDNSAILINEKHLVDVFHKNILCYPRHFKISYNGTIARCCDVPSDIEENIFALPNIEEYLDKPVYCSYCFSTDSGPQNPRIKIK